MTLLYELPMIVAGPSQLPQHHLDVPQRFAVLGHSLRSSLHPELLRLVSLRPASVTEQSFDFRRSRYRGSSSNDVTILRLDAIVAPTVARMVLRIPQTLGEKLFTRPERARAASPFDGSTVLEGGTS